MGVILLTDKFFEHTFIKYNSIQDMFINHSFNIFKMVKLFKNYPDYKRFNFLTLYDKIYHLKGDTIEEIILKLQLDGYML